MKTASHFAAERIPDPASRPMSGWMSSCMPILTWAIGIFLVVRGASGQIITDGTLNNLPGQELNLPDVPEIHIPHTLGVQKGGNLFHSFSEFNVGVGEMATFSGPADVSNILARVTGGNSSNINGTLRSTIDDANLFLINPNGFVFGEGAKLDITGSFSATTASGVKLGGEDVFDAVDHSMKILSSASPEEFGFLKPEQGNVELNGSRLQVGPNGSISLSGKTVSIKNANLEAPKSIRVGATGEEGKTGIEIDQAAIGNGAKDLQIVVNKGHLSVENGSELLANSIVVVVADSMNVHKSIIEGGQESSSVNLQIRDDLELTNESKIRSFDEVTLSTPTIRINNSTVGGRGVASKMSLVATHALILENGSRIHAFKKLDVEVNKGEIRINNSTVGGSEVAGTIEITASESSLTVENEGRIQTWGDMTLSSKTLNVDGAAILIGSAVSREASGVRGEESNDAELMPRRGIDAVEERGIETYQVPQGSEYEATVTHVLKIEETDTVKVSNGGIIASRVEGGGAIGWINVKANKDVLIDGTDSSRQTGIYSIVVGGDSGSDSVQKNGILINADDTISIVNGGGISGLSSQGGKGGDIEVVAKNLKIDGEGDSRSEPSSQSKDTGIIVTALSSSIAGEIDIGVTGGDVEIVGREDMKGESGVFMSAQAPNASAKNIKVQAENIGLIKGAIIELEHFGTEKPLASSNVKLGRILILARGSLELSGESEIKLTSPPPLASSKETLSEVGIAVGTLLELKNSRIIVDNGGSGGFRVLPSGALPEKATVILGGDRGSAIAVEDVQIGEGIETVIVVASESSVIGTASGGEGDHTPRLVTLNVTGGQLVDFADLRPEDAELTTEQSISQSEADRVGYFVPPSHGEGQREDLLELRIGETDGNGAE